jgi:hypothetical protein
VRVDDAAEPYIVEIAITLRAAPDASQARRTRTNAIWQCPCSLLTLLPTLQQNEQTVYARGTAIFHKIGAVRSLNS